MSKSRNPKGLGSYRKRDDNTYEWRQKIDGVPRSLYAPSLQELRDKVKKIINAPIPKEKYTVKQWLENWLSVYVKPLLESETYNQYDYVIKSHVLPQMGKKKMTSIGQYDIQQVISVMHSKNLSHWTMYHAKKVMNIAFKKAAAEQIISANPVVDIIIPKTQEKARKVLTTRELAKLFKSLNTSRWLTSVKFMLETGLRRGELLALEWSDIDFDNHRIKIDKSNDKGTKNNKIHYVPLTKNILLYLQEQKDMLIAEFNPMLHNPQLKKLDLIFPSENGTRLFPQSYTTMLRRAGEKVGLSVSPHCLRHTLVFLSRDNLSLKDLQNILGHSKSTTTLDIYGDIISDNNERVAAEMDNIFEKINKNIEKESIKNDKKIIQLRR
jgi:integrase